MALTSEQRAALERLGPQNVRQQLDRAGAWRGAVVPGVGDGLTSRGDAQDWLVEVEGQAAQQLLQLQERTLLWAKAAAWIGVASIIVTVVIAVLQRN